MQKNTKMKKTFRFILPILAAGAIVAASVNPDVKADDPVKGALPVYDIEVGDTNVASTLKEDVIKDRCEIDENLDLNNINVDLSSIDITGLNINQAGIQRATLKVNLVDANNTTDSVGYSFTQEVVVNMKVASAPQLKLKAQEVTVNNGDTFVAESYISYVNDAQSNPKPVLKVDTHNLDMNVDGQYVVSYTAVDQKGNTTEQDLIVNVQTPEEVLQAQAAEAEAQAQAEAEAQAQAAEAARQAELAASLGASGENTNTSNLGYSAGGANPYGGGWSNCTYGAWQALYNARGIALPNLGNASEWYSNAAAAGYSVSGTPTVGGIAVYNGHVAYVDGVDGDMVHIVEGGFSGHYNERWVSSSGTGTKSTIGYINV